MTESRNRKRRPPDEQGAVVTAIVMGMFPVLIVCVGLVVDSGLSRVTRSEISLALETAARAGATQIDQNSSAARPAVDQRAGPSVAAAYYRLNRPAGLLCGTGESNVDLPVRGCWQRITFSVTQRPDGAARFEVTVVENVRTVGLSSWLGRTEQSFRVTAVAVVGNSGL